MSAETLASAIVGHLVGDYLLQNDWMALNKKRNIYICMVHCMIWAAVVMAFAGWHSFELPKSRLIWGILLVTHFFQDHTNIIMYWMTKVNRQQQFATGPCAPWSIIVVDNVWHIVTIWCVWRFLA